MKRLLTSIAAASVVIAASVPIVLARDCLQPAHNSIATYSNATAPLTGHGTGSRRGSDVVAVAYPAGTVDPSYHRWDVRSSVQVSRDAIREAYIASRDAYTKKLQKYASCSQRDAEKAALSAHPGMKLDMIQLRNIKTNLVYMAVVEDEEDKFLVIVDAGNGKVLMDRPLPTHHEKAFANGD